jgi:cystathionine beta-lyase/cystathionine gamma-synthase
MDSLEQQTLNLNDLIVSQETLVIEKRKKQTYYCRTSSKKRIELQDKLLEYYNFKKSDDSVCAEIFPSGMSAINAVIDTYHIDVLDEIKESNATHPNKYIITSDELYCDTFSVCDYYGSNFVHIMLDIRDNNRIIDTFKQHGLNIKIFLIESCSNPSGQMFDFSVWPLLKQYSPQCLFVVDNTWLSGCSFNPFIHGASCVIESMTKYISANNCIGGMMIGKKDLMYKINKHISIHGLFVGADHCQIFIDGLNTINNRIKKASQLTLQIAEWLEKQSEVSRVMYPMLASHPTHNIVIQHVKYGPAILFFHIPSVIDDLTQARAMLKNQYLPLETSYGSAYSKIDRYPVIFVNNGYDPVDSEYFKKPSVDGVWIRLSVGYDSDFETIINGLKQVFYCNSSICQDNNNNNNNDNK